MHPSAYEDASKFVAKCLNRDVTTTIVDVGAADINGTLRPLFDSPAWKYFGLDSAAGPNVDIVPDKPYEWATIRGQPGILTASVDAVVCTQTLEHCPQPWWLVREIARIVRPGGFVYLCAPNSIPFHEYPVDCWRVWPDGMRGLMADAGIECLEAYTFEGDGVGCTTAIGRNRWSGYVHQRFVRE